MGAKIFENEHIDMFAKLPSDENIVFEVKSINDKNTLSQSRKGLSQLYEYRYRYKAVVGHNAALFLIYPKEPTGIPWLQKYLCEDRRIGVAWFDGDTLSYSPFCGDLGDCLSA